VKLFLLALVLPSVLFAQESDLKINHESEVSYVNSGGNSDVTTTSGKTETKFALNANALTLSGKYVYGQTSDVISAENWNAGLRYDRSLNAHFSLFAGELLEADRFAGVKRRYNTDLGSAYQAIKTQKNTTSVELGYRYTIEKAYPETLGKKSSSKIRLFAESAQKLSATQEIKLKTEYLANLSDSEDWIITIGGSLQSSLSSVFSLKVGHDWTRDNLPPAGKSTIDRLTTLALVAKF
jgi:putative salt-induced outer membrane protein